MKRGKWIAWIIVIGVIALASFGIYQYYFKEDAKSTLTLVEKEWIESNKNKIIDLGITGSVPVFTRDGDGVVFNFLESMEYDTKLEFNRIPFTSNEDAKDIEYAFQVVDKKGKQDILMYQDNYALLTNKKVTYYQATDLRNLRIGVLTSDLKEVNYYLSSGSNLVYQTFHSITELMAAITENKVDAIAIPKMYYLSEIGMHDKLNISYNITEMTKDYVLRLGKNSRLNTIIKKYYTKWAKENYKDSFNKNLSSIYFAVHNIDEQDKSRFHSKRYTYGFVSNRPYLTNIDGKLYGYNMKQLKNFLQVADIEIDYKMYRSNIELQEAFDKNEIDFFYDMTSTRNYKIDTYETVGLEGATVVITTPINRSVVVNSLTSLNGKKVGVVKDSRIAEELKKARADVKTYRTVSELIKHRNDVTLLALDYHSFEYYRHNELKNYSIDYMGTIGSYYYRVRDIKANKVFADYLNFYFSMVNNNVTFNDSIYTLLQIGNKPYIIKNLIILISGCLIVFLGYLGIKKYKEIEANDSTISKTDKLRYIDSLTSLKNRTYLNDHIEQWDNSEVYPQAIIIVDLNNIAYINDNYGHQEGDSIIKEAANKLIMTQIENSDIIRTNGNEFLIYLVGYDEKQVITYMRKLNKELKDLSHGYGAALGYSMITDAIKTIDDAVNEATLDMRNNKEELNN